MQMKKVVTVMVMLLLGITVNAQNQQRRFSPDKFDADIRDYIVQESKLSKAEAETFLAVYKEMQEKQRQLYERQRALAKQRPQDDNGFKKAIKERDDIEMELKRLQISYHQKFLKILPPCKVYDIIRAETRFHRRTMRMGLENRPHSENGHPKNKKPQK